MNVVIQRPQWMKNNWEVIVFGNLFQAKNNTNQYDAEFFVESKRQEMIIISEINWKIFLYLHDLLFYICVKKVITWI